MRIAALLTVSTAVLALAACNKPADEHAAPPANDAVEAAGAAEDSVLTTEQAAEAADQAARDAGASDAAAPTAPPTELTTEPTPPATAPAAH